jgi:hypothetical protein
MNWSALWKSSAETELARLWTESNDREAVTRAADRIDAALRTNPMSQGESRSGRTRIMFESPLAVLFDVYPEEQLVYVLAVQIVGERSGPKDD